MKGTKELAASLLAASLLLVLTMQATAQNALVRPPAGTAIEVVDSRNTLLGPVYLLPDYGFPESLVVMKAKEQFITLPFRASGFAIPLEYLLFTTPDCSGQAWLAASDIPELFARAALVPPGNTLWISEDNPLVEQQSINSAQTKPENTYNNDPNGCVVTSGWGIEVVRAQQVINLDTLFQPPFRLRSKKGR